MRVVMFELKSSLERALMRWLNSSSSFDSFPRRSVVSLYENCFAEIIVEIPLRVEETSCSAGRSLKIAKALLRCICTRSSRPWRSSIVMKSKLPRMASFQLCSEVSSLWLSS